MRKLPTQAVLQELFDYDRDTGIFRWRKSTRGGRRLAGDIAGTRIKSGYVFISVGGLGQFGAHRLAWIYVHGLQIGGAEVDHKDTNPSNNAIGNLRLATSSEQKQNKKVQSNNRSGLKGAYYHDCRKGKKWRSQIKVGDRLIFLGYFHTDIEAHRAYAAAAVEHFGEFARVA
jgi:hypothetical protein